MHNTLLHHTRFLHQVLIQYYFLNLSYPYRIYRQFRIGGDLIELRNFIFFIKVSFLTVKKRTIEPL